MEIFYNLLTSIDGYLGSAWWFPYVLLGVGLFFTVYLKFPQIRFFKHAWSVLMGKFAKKDPPGDTSHFQALTTALSGTVGMGNIGGVAFAIFLGGPAALFWMWATAFFGMTTKFVEVTLSHKYRVKTEDGTMAGGPMYFMDRRLNMKWLAVAFAVATVISSFGTGSLPQSNGIATSMQSTFGISPVVTGAVLAVLLGLVIIGGIKRIAAVTSKIVPAMALIYIVGALAVILANLENVGPSFVAVFSDAFTGSAAAGGFLGATFAYAFNRGVNRGLFSNEAGQGSAPIAHASAKTEEPVAEGMVSILEPFIDTIIICTLTGLVILSSGVWNQKFENDFPRADMMFVSGQYSDQKDQDKVQLFQYLNNVDGHQVNGYSGELQVAAGTIIGDEITVINARSVAEDVKVSRDGELYTGVIEVNNGALQTADITVSGKSLIHSAPLTAKAFTKGFFGEAGQYIVSIGLLLFAFSTAIAWSYYGDRAMTYLFGAKSVLPYRVVYVVGFFVAAVVDTTIVWALSAVAIVVMTLPNLFGIMLLRKEMRDEVNEYWKKMKDK